jgi:hypothetical protein
LSVHFELKEEEEEEEEEGEEEEMIHDVLVGSFVCLLCYMIDRRTTRINHTP